MFDSPVTGSVAGTGVVDGAGCTGLVATVADPDGFGLADFDGPAVADGERLALGDFDGDALGDFDGLGEVLGDGHTHGSGWPQLPGFGAAECQTKQASSLRFSQM